MKKQICLPAVLLAALTVTGCNPDGFRFHTADESESSAEASLTEPAAESSRERPDTPDPDSSGEEITGQLISDGSAVRFRYQTENNVAVLQDLSADSAAAELVIPEELNGVPVAEIAEYGFYGTERFTSLRIPGSIRRLGDYSFSNCSNMRKAVFENANAELGEYCFQTSGLEAFYSEGSLKMQDYCFGDTVSLQTVILRGDNEFGEYCFRNCPKLHDLWLTDGKVRIGDYSFSQTGAEWVMLRDCSGTIGDYCFIENHALQTAVISEGITEMGEDCFIRCPSLRYVVLPASLKRIGESSFSDCKDLTIIAPKGSYAMRYAQENGFAVMAAEDSDIPDSAPEMPEWDAELPELSYFASDFDSTTEHIVTMNSGDTAEYADGSYRNASKLSDVSLSGTVIIGRECFTDCPLLEYVIFTDGDVKIGDGSFSGSGVVDLFSRECNMTIGENCFCKMYRLSSVTIEEGLTFIGAGSFSDCPSLDIVELPASLTEIGEGCFTDCSEDMIIVAPKGSYAAEYAKAHGIHCSER